MDEHAASRKLSMQEASDAVTGLGWRYILGVLRTYVRVGSLAQAAEVARRVVAAAGPDADACLQLDVRRDRLVLTLQSLDTNQVTAREAEVARRISAAVTELGLATDAGVGGPRSAQLLEIAIDALDIPAVRPFWAAVLGYDEGGGKNLVDPESVRPLVWFQQMDAPRPQRNRIHFDVSVPHDEAEARMAGGRGAAAGSGLRHGGAGVLGARRPRGQRGLRHDLAGPGVASRPALSRWISKNGDRMMNRAESIRTRPTPTIPTSDQSCDAGADSSDLTRIQPRNTQARMGRMPTISASQALLKTRLR